MPSPMAEAAATVHRWRRRRLLLLLCVVAVAVVHGQQPDSLGFISIDCGIPDGGGYSDESTRGLRYVPDAGFLDAGAGLSAGINPPYTDRDLAARYLTVRYFPGGAAGERGGCYTLRQLSPGGRYLVRATFYYGNYDGAIAMLPVVFDLHLGANRWAAVNVTAADAIYIFEAVVSPPAEFLQVCLVNIGKGTPFISGLDLRPLKPELYPEATANQSLLLLNHDRPPARFAFNRYQYPFDPYDRLWQPYGDDPSWTNITVAAAVDVTNISRSDDPSPILRSAATPANATARRLDFPWSSDDDATNTYLLLLYFAELQRLPAGAARRFDVLVDGDASAAAGGRRGYTPRYLAAEVVRATVRAAQPGQRHVVSLVAAPDSALPPIVNGLEIYSVQPMPELATNDRDAKAMMEIRGKYELKKNWMGDPCAPKAFAWVGLNCSYSSSDPALITALNLSSSVLTGPVNLSFGDLKSLQYLDLSNNSLSGPIPDFLAQMPALKFLDLSSNKLSGSIPSDLLQKRENGSLVLRIGNNANLCYNGANNTCAPESKQSKRILVIAIAVPIVAATLLFVAAIVILHRRRNKQDTWITNNARLISPRERLNVFENRQFTYRELKLMTSNFKEEIGKGGFGTVFLGYLEDGTPVAVKMCSKTSSEGDKEFLAEAQHLTRVHHRNLVSLIGYCKDKKHLALVYEYMQGGNLEDRLRGEASIAAPLTWHQRLKIALDSAQGLEYLHKSCQPPLIHRDVKTRNILLSGDLDAKIADFGLTKVFAGGDVVTHVTTQPAGTLGYLDPEYYHTSRLSEKSDVYSFGVVLLELVTGRPPAVPLADGDDGDGDGGGESVHLAVWARQRLGEGDIESVADAAMGGCFEVNSAWKVAELALRCKERPSRERPAMADVVAELKECLELEASRALGCGGGSSVATMTTSTSGGGATNVSAAASAASVSDAQIGELRQESVLELGPR
uniref:non-specific serine/threonine protein kinase n=1 Tax=Oryza meridionalis TaxID=40149 RepID=A0A0E0EMX1_9ORYZ